MKKVIVVAAAVLALGACAPLKESKVPDPTRPAIVLAAPDYLVVNQEPIVIRRGGRDVDVTWHLPLAGSLRFDGRGIFVEGLIKTLPKDGSRRLPQPDTSQNELFKCEARKDGLEAVCRIGREIKPGVYAYTIRARDGQRRIVLDPTIMIE